MGTSPTFTSLSPHRRRSRAGTRVGGAGKWRVDPRLTITGVGDRDKERDRFGVSVLEDVFHSDDEDHLLPHLPRLPTTTTTTHSSSRTGAVGRQTRGRVQPLRCRLRLRTWWLRMETRSYGQDGIHVFPPLPLPHLPSHPTYPRTLPPPTAFTLPTSTTSTNYKPHGTHQTQSATQCKKKPLVPGLQMRFTDMGLHELRRDV